MKCPHCLEGIHEAWTNSTEVGGDIDSPTWRVNSFACPECKRLIVRLQHLVTRDGGQTWQADIVRPKAAARAALPSEVEEGYASDYREACLVLADSPKASAALSRRCLQNILREKANVSPGNLNDEIDHAMQSLPTHLADAIDGIRVVGNFAAHPLKSTNTGEVIDVEPGEAEWLLDVLEGLFDFYFVQPSRLAARRAAVDAKLSEAGKPPMK